MKLVPHPIPREREKKHRMTLDKKEVSASMEKIKEPLNFKKMPTCISNR